MSVKCADDRIYLRWQLGTVVLTIKLIGPTDFLELCRKSYAFYKIFFYLTVPRRLQIP